MLSFLLLCREWLRCIIISHMCGPTHTASYLWNTKTVIYDTDMSTERKCETVTFFLTQCPLALISGCVSSGEVMIQSFTINSSGNYTQTAAGKQLCVAQKLEKASQICQANGGNQLQLRIKWTEISGINVLFNLLARKQIILNDAFNTNQQLKSQIFPSSGGGDQKQS